MNFLIYVYPILMHQENNLIFGGLKNGFSTTHPLLPDEYNLIKLWLKQRKLIENGVEGDWLFLSRKRRPISRQHFFSIIREAGRRAGLAVKAHPHMLRHACGFALADNGVDTRLLQDYLGHRNIQHTVRYTASNAARFKGVWKKKASLKTVPSDSKCQIPTFFLNSSIKKTAHSIQ